MVTRAYTPARCGASRRPPDDSCTAMPHKKRGRRGGDMAAEAEAGFLGAGYWCGGWRRRSCFARGGGAGAEGV
jgi:hypothetical protein